eukprot:s1261_g20.t1
MCRAVADLQHQLRTIVCLSFFFFFFCFCFFFFFFFFFLAVDIHLQFKIQCDFMSLVVSGSLLLEAFLQTTRARRSISRFFKSHAVLALDRYCHARVLGRCQQLHNDHDDDKRRPHPGKFRIHGRPIFCSCGSHSSNLLRSFELSQGTVSLQWLIARRVEMHHEKTHHEIPSQFLQALG